MNQRSVSRPAVVAALSVPALSPFARSRPFPFGRSGAGTPGIAGSDGQRFRGRFRSICLCRFGRAPPPRFEAVSAMMAMAGSVSTARTVPDHEFVVIVVIELENVERAAVEVIGFRVHRLGRLRAVPMARPLELGLSPPFDGAMASNVAPRGSPAEFGSGALLRFGPREAAR